MSNGDGKNWKAGLLLLIAFAGAGYGVGHIVGGESEDHIHDEIAITEQFKDSVLRESGGAYSACRITVPSGDQRKVYVAAHKSDSSSATVVVTDTGADPKVVLCSTVQWDIVRPTRLVTVWIAKMR